MVLTVYVACFLASLKLAHTGRLDQVAKGSSFSATAIVLSAVIHNVFVALRGWCADTLCCFKQGFSCHEWHKPLSQNSDIHITLTESISENCCMGKLTVCK